MKKKAELGKTGGSGSLFHSHSMPFALQEVKSLNPVPVAESPQRQPGRRQNPDREPAPTEGHQTSPA